MRIQTLLLPLLALLATGCASRGPAPVTHLDAQRCATASTLDGAAILKLDEPQGETLNFDGRASCVVEGEQAPASYAIVRLPRFRQAWVMTLQSALTGQSLFAPEVFTLDAQGRVLRSLPFERFTLRGDQLTAALFFDETNAAERYVLVRSANEAVGRQGRQVVSGAFAIPLLNGLMPILYMQGTEHERGYTLSHNGRVNLLARTAAATRRTPRAHDLARAELGAMAH